MLLFKGTKLVEQRKLWAGLVFLLDGPPSKESDTLPHFVKVCCDFSRYRIRFYCIILKRKYHDFSQICLFPFTYSTKFEWIPIQWIRQKGCRTDLKDRDQECSRWLT